MKAKALPWCTILVLTLLANSPAPAQEVETQSNNMSVGDRAFFERLARKIEPQLQGQPSRLPQYVRFYQTELANDVRLFAFHVTAAPFVDEPMSIRLSGYVEFAEHRTAVANLLRVLGFDVRANDVELLPDPQLGESRFGLLTASSSLSYDRPSGDRDVVTECLLGEPLFLLKQEDGHFLCHSGEGYLGYVDIRDVRPVTQQQFTAYLAGDRLSVRSSHRAGERYLPAGTQLKLVSASPEQLEAELPDGTIIRLSPSQCGAQPAPEKTIERIITTGRELLDTKYRWGGKTSAGIDCSGLVQVAYGAAGLHLPRDSNQQIFLGKLTATRWCRSTMRRGDTMYFLGSRGRIRHTAIYLGDNRFLHAQLPTVTISSLDPADPTYEARRDAAFAFAKRLIE